VKVFKQRQAAGNVRLEGAGSRVRGGRVHSEVAVDLAITGRSSGGERFRCSFNAGLSGSVKGWMRRRGSRLHPHPLP
jgi:hypothetical protein